MSRDPTELAEQWAREPERPILIVDEAREHEAGVEFVTFCCVVPLLLPGSTTGTHDVTTPIRIYHSHPVGGRALAITNRLRLGKSPFQLRQQVLPVRSHLHQRSQIFGLWQSTQ